jgi:hypothetical protein
LDAELSAEDRGNAAYEHYRATGRMKNGRRFGAPPKPYQPPATPEGVVNLTDPDSHVMKCHHHAYPSTPNWSRSETKSSSSPRESGA